ncbi:erg26, C-3 sterol dehydrogenase [Polyrhizophydium stewartii]|uniref:Erg26, C-3 sterol dehydrogenase n=1 Tax=Polyrhizophydium stewartii TaxID=2732419 RepID=A0ABR4NH23_9FUNG
MVQKLDHYLVIGGGGFLGRVIVNQLLERGDTVSVFDLRRSFEDPRLSEFIVGDITSPADVLRACEGKTVVMHTASPPHGLPSSAYFKVNVDGTKNVIRACVQAGVSKLVFTSSASVIFNGKDLINGNEELPYCDVHMDAYNETKALGEQAVLSANGQGGLLTVALRPSGIFGPRDMQGILAMVRAARRGQWRFIIGDNQNLFDMTYVDNAAYAHVLAADKLAPDNGTAGEAFIITNDQPTFFWDFPKILHHELGYRGTQSIVISRPIGMLLGSIADGIAWLLRPIKEIHPNISRFRVQMVTANRYFDISKAKQRLGYKPIVSLQEALRITAEHWMDFEAK